MDHIGSVEIRRLRGPGDAAGAVTGASNAGAPIAISTMGTPGLTNNMVVEIGGIQGNTAANGLFVVSNVSGTGFTSAVLPAREHTRVAARGVARTADQVRSPVQRAAARSQITTPLTHNADERCLGGGQRRRWQHGRQRQISRCRERQSGDDNIYARWHAEQRSIHLRRHFYGTPTSTTAITNATSVGTGPNYRHDREHNWSETTTTSC